MKICVLVLAYIQYVGVSVPVFICVSVSNPRLWESDRDTVPLRVSGR